MTVNLADYDVHIIGSPDYWIRQIGGGTFQQAKLHWITHHY